MEIYIVRHGETIWNADKRIQGRADIELNTNGRELAGITGKALEDVDFDRIYASPLIRAYETACLLRGYRNIPIIRDERLKELSFGVFEGASFPEKLADLDHPFHHFFKHPELYVAPPEGETLEELCIRAQSFMAEIIEPLEESVDRIMIVAHGAFNKGIMSHIKEHDISEFWSGGLQKNCNIIIIKYENNRYTIIDETVILY